MEVRGLGVADGESGLGQPEAGAGPIRGFGGLQIAGPVEDGVRDLAGAKPEEPGSEQRLGRTLRAGRGVPEANVGGHSLLAAAQRLQEQGSRPRRLPEQAISLQVLQGCQGRVVLCQGLVRLARALGQERQVVAAFRLAGGARVLFQRKPERLLRLLVGAVAEQDYAPVGGAQGGDGGELGPAEGFQGARVPGIVEGEGDQAVLVALFIADTAGQRGHQPQRLPSIEGRGGVLAE